MISAAHHGSWRGPNLLWLEAPGPERSDGSMDVAATTVAYTWSFKGQPIAGRIALFGQPGALRAEWTDGFHAADGITLHGLLDAGVLRLYGTYAAGDGPEWGWRIELDTREADACTLRMFNLPPDGPAEPAVELRGTR
jgi:hypothetical protein